MIVKLLQVIDLIGGAGEDRTHDLLTASQALSQLSYSPTALKHTRHRHLSQAAQSGCQKPSLTPKPDRTTVLRQNINGKKFISPVRKKSATIPPVSKA
jgi:hypothetical protein